MLKRFIEVVVASAALTLPAAAASEPPEWNHATRMVFPSNGANVVVLNAKCMEEDAASAYLESRSAVPMFFGSIDAKQHLYFFATADNKVHVAVVLEDNTTCFVADIENMKMFEPPAGSSPPKQDDQSF